MCSGNNSNTPIIPTVTTTTTTTTTTTATAMTVTSSSTVDPDIAQHGSSGASGHQPSSSWYRHALDSSGSAPSSVNVANNTAELTNTATSSTAGSHHQRLWRISRRVYLRRPRLLALGPRSRTMARQLSSNSTASPKNYTSIFR
jgi:hypothetical protein